MESLPEATKAILESKYMDDSLISVETEEQAVKMYKDLKWLWKQAGMDAKKWVSNSQSLRNIIPEGDKAKVYQILNEDEKVTKTLGLIWDTERDEFSFNAREEVAEWCTKRQILSALAKVYDPIGFLTAYLMLGNILIQEIWMNGTDWDIEIS